MKMLEATWADSRFIMFTHASLSLWSCHCMFSFLVAREVDWVGLVETSKSRTYTHLTIHQSSLLWSWLVQHDFLTVEVFWFEKRNFFNTFSLQHPQDWSLLSSEETCFNTFSTQFTQATAILMCGKSVPHIFLTSACLTLITDKISLHFSTVRNFPNVVFLTWFPHIFQIPDIFLTFSIHFPYMGMS